MSGVQESRISSAARRGRASPPGIATPAGPVPPSIRVGSLARAGGGAGFPSLALPRRGNCGPGPGAGAAIRTATGGRATGVGEAAQKAPVRWHPPPRDRCGA